MEGIIRNPRTLDASSLRLWAGGRREIMIWRAAIRCSAGGGGRRRRQYVEIFRDKPPLLPPLFRGIREASARRLRSRRSLPACVRSAEGLRDAVDAVVKIVN